MDLIFDKRVNYLLIHKNKVRGNFVFVPGTGCTPAFYDAFLRRLYEEDFNVIGYDYPGHGPRKEKKGHFMIGDVLQEIEGLCCEVKEKLGSPVILIGSSMGGIITYFSFFRNKFADAFICHNALVIPWVIKNLPFPVRGLAKISLYIFKILAEIFPEKYVSTGIYVRWRYVFEERKNLKELRSHPWFVKKYTLSSIYSLFSYEP